MSKKPRTDQKMLAVRNGIPDLMKEIARTQNRMFAVEATSALIRWLYAQPPEVQHAIIRAGSGSPVFDEAAVKKRVTFEPVSEETPARASSSGPPQQGKRTRSAA